ncbi:Bug family tripartite tricarboxylate transporter substrate binding protein [Orrella sp. 11846]|uniref:Bug family tripartite tricarboxylate transporter substrate binding protein n=1 Tax=Orrella sp. 11846 TaxID=3409913 RepID=UPI003B5C7EC0
MRKTLTKSSVLGIAASAVTMTFALTPLSAVAQADNYPAKPIHMIVGYPPSGATDIVARLVGAKMEKHLGQPIVIDNKPGGGSNIAASEAARAKPDGYTLFMATIAQAINPAVYSNLTYDTLKDFEPITQTMTSPSILVVNNDFPAKTVAELVEWAKAHPGELTLASSGAGGSPHLAAELFKLRTGVEYLHVPYKGAGPAMNDVLAGVVMGGFKTATAALPQIKAGMVRPLAVASAERLKDLPDVPTMQEAGIQDFQVASWNGLMVPKGTPQPIMDKITEAAIIALKDPEIVEQFESRAATVGGESPEEFRAFLEKQLSTWKEVADAANVRIN